LGGRLRTVSSESRPHLVGLSHVAGPVLLAPLLGGNGRAPHPLLPDRSHPWRDAQPVLARLESVGGREPARTHARTAAIQHLFVLMLAPERRDFGATATVFCYSSGVGLLTAVLPPAFGFGAALGGLFGSFYLVVYSMLALAVQLWYVAVLVFGMRRAHSTTTGRAIAVVLLPIGVGFALVLGLAIVAAALIAFAELPV